MSVSIRFGLATVIPFVLAIIVVVVSGHLGAILVTFVLAATFCGVYQFSLRCPQCSEPLAFWQKYHGPFITRCGRCGHDLTQS